MGVYLTQHLQFSLKTSSEYILFTLLLKTTKTTEHSAATHHAVTFNWPDYKTFFYSRFQHFLFCIAVLTMGTVICHPSTDIVAQCSACLPKTPFGKKRGKLQLIFDCFSSTHFPQSDFFTFIETRKKWKVFLLFHLPFISFFLYFQFRNLEYSNH